MDVFFGNLPIPDVFGILQSLRAIADFAGGITCKYHDGAINIISLFQLWCHTSSHLR